jgi:hypothetical protein
MPRSGGQVMPETCRANTRYTVVSWPWQTLVSCSRYRHVDDLFNGDTDDSGRLGKLNCAWSVLAQDVQRGARLTVAGEGGMIQSLGTSSPQPKPNLAAISTYARATGELVRASALFARLDPWRSWSRVPSCEFRGRNQQAALMRDPFPGGLVIAMLLLGRRVETPNGVGQRRRASLASAVCSSSFSVHASGPDAPPRNGVQSSSRRPLVLHILFRGHTRSVRATR